MAICQLFSIKLQKEVKFNSKTALLLKKCVAPKKAIVKKGVKSGWQPRNGCDGSLIAEILIMTIWVKLVPNPNKTWRRQQNFTWIFIIKLFAMNLRSQPFLGCHLGFHIFFHNGFLGSCTLSGLFLFYHISIR